VKLNEYETLLGKSQAAQNELRSDLTKMQQELFAAQKKAAETEVHARFVSAKNETLIAQARALDARIREMESQKQKAEANAEAIALVLQRIQAGSGEDQTSDTLGLGLLGPGGVSPDVTKVDPTAKGSRDLLEPIRIRGKVLEVQMDDRIPYITINLGEDDKIKVGMNLHVFRLSPPEYIGIMRVTRIDYQRAAGRVDLLRQGKEIQPGDEVTNDLKTLR
jgi:hypothetical protein